MKNILICWALVFGLNAIALDVNRNTFLCVPAVNVAGGVVFSDVAYLPEERAERLDVYLPTAVGNRPCVLYIHGGGWHSGDKNAPRFREIIAEPLLAEGIAVVSINYNLDVPRWPRNLWDCKQALRFLKRHAAELGVDAGHVVVCGGSAGGHLALMMALTAGDSRYDEPGTPDKPDSTLAGGIGLFGIVDLRLARINHEPKTWGNVVFAHTEHAVDDSDPDKVFPQIWKEASPICLMAKDAIPLLVVHGDRDTIVEVGQSERLYEKGRALGAPIEWMRVPGAPHGLRACTFPGVMERMVSFLKECTITQSR